MTVPRDLVRAEIERLRRRYVSLVEEEHEAPSTWEILEEALCWHVVLRDALEPDIDVELLEDAIVVRASVERTVRLCVLPVPAPFRGRRPVFRFRADVLEVRLG